MCENRPDRGGRCLFFLTMQCLTILNNVLKNCKTSLKRCILRWFCKKNSEMQIKKLFLNEINLSSNRVHRRNSRTFLKKVFGTFPSAILLPIEKFHATVTATWNKKMKSRMILRNSVSQCPLHLLSKWIALYYVVCLSVSMATSPFISTVWCSRPYRPYIFWKLIIWLWQWECQRW